MFFASTTIHGASVDNWLDSSFLCQPLNWRLAAQRLCAFDFRGKCLTLLFSLLFFSFSISLRFFFEFPCFFYGCSLLFQGFWGVPPRERHLLFSGFPFFTGLKGQGSQQRLRKNVSMKSRELRAPIRWFPKGGFCEEGGGGISIIRVVRAPVAIILRFLFCAGAHCLILYMRAPSSTPTQRTPQTWTMVWVSLPRNSDHGLRFWFFLVNTESGVVWVLVWVFLGPWSEFPPARAETLG